MNIVRKSFFIALLLSLGFAIGTLSTSNVTAQTASVEQDFLSKQQTRLSSEPDGYAVRAISELMLDIVQAVNGDGEQSRARHEARDVISKLEKISLTGEGKHHDYEQVSQFFVALHTYAEKRDSDRNTLLSCQAAARLFHSLSIMEDDAISEKKQQSEAGNFFYALAELLDLERQDEPIEVVTSGEVDLFKSLGDICRAESSGSDRETKQALRSMFRSLGKIAAEEQ